MKSVETIPDGPEWQYEPKWDGFRALVHRDGDTSIIVSKNGLPLGRYFPEIVAALRALAADGFRSTASSSYPTPARCRSTRCSNGCIRRRVAWRCSRRRRRRSISSSIVLRDGGDDVVRVAAARTRVRYSSVLRAAFPARRPVAAESGDDRTRVVDGWFARVGGALDGVIAKRVDRAYASGKRDAAVKIKKMRTADCVVGGFRLRGRIDRSRGQFAARPLR
jgi:hypothetical protein